MNTIVYFGMSVALGLVAWFTIFATIIWPKMKSQPKIQQLKSLTAISFFRYFATTFLIVGLVTRKLPAGFADPAAFGDLIALVLAYIAFIGLQRSRAERPRLLPVDIQRRRRCRLALCLCYRPLPYQGSGQLRPYIHHSDGVRSVAADGPFLRV